MAIPGISAVRDLSVPVWLAAAVLALPAHAEEGAPGTRAKLKVGGALRANYIYKDWDPAFGDSGRLDFDMASVTLDLDSASWIGSAQYRYYRYRGGHFTHFLHHGWLGYRFDGGDEVQVGVHQVPFGILPFASHNWFFQLPYYVGLEDDYDLGVKYVRQAGPWNWQFAYYVSAEPDGRGDSHDSARYSYDVVKDAGSDNRERNQLNARLAYRFPHGADASTEVGVSLQYGQIRNDATRRDGHHQASAAHLDGRYGRWGLKLEAIDYRYTLKNPPGQDGRFVVMGAYDFPYRVAARGTLYVAGVSYGLPVTWGPVTKVTFYNDYSILVKDQRGFRDTQHNVLGAALTAGKLLVYVDLGYGRHHPYLSPDFTEGLAAGSGDDGWHKRFNINVGYYF